MSDHPVNDVYADGSPVSKGAVRNLETIRNALVLSGPSEILALALPGVAAVICAGWLYRYVTGATDAHDGDVFLVSADGRVYRRHRAVDDLATADLNDLLADEPLDVTGLAPDDDDAVLMTRSGVTEWVSPEVLADALDEALGSGTWRGGPGDLTIGSLITALPANIRRGMNGGQVRAGVMADGTFGIGGLTDSGGLGPGIVQTGTIVRIPLPPGITIKKAFVGGKSAWIIDQNDDVWAVGANGFGQLGIGSTANAVTWTKIQYFATNGIKIADIVPQLVGAAGVSQNVFFRSIAGKAYGAGRNNNSTLGDNTTTQRTTPVEVGNGAMLSGALTVADIFTGESGSPSFFLLSDGSWRVCGPQPSGQAGTNSTADLPLPVVATALAGYTKVVTSSASSLALKASTGEVKACGHNAYGSLGLGDTTARLVWTVNSSFGPGALVATDIAMTQGHGTCAALVSVSGATELRTWGMNSQGACGTGNTTNQTAPYRPTAAWQGSVVRVMAGGQNAGTDYAALYVQTGPSTMVAAGYNGFNNLCAGLIGGTSNTFIDVLGIRGTIDDWAVFGGAGGQAFGLLVVASKGVFSGGANSSNDAVIGVSANNVASVQDISVAPIMGPDGTDGTSFVFDGIGTLTARPAATSVSPGYRYLVTDGVTYSVFYQSNGAVWSSPSVVFRGREIELQAGSTHIQYRYAGDATWTNLISIAAITGPVNSLAIGTVTTGAAGSTASATVTGTAPTQMLNLTIPRGDTGATGPTGGVTSVAGRAGAVTLSNTDISGLGTASTKNTGTAAGNIPVLDASGRMPAVDGSQLTGVVASLPVGAVVGVAHGTYTANADITVGIPYDATKPQVGEGVQIMTASIDPKAAGDILWVDVVIPMASGGGAPSNIVAAVFLNGGANAVGAAAIVNVSTGYVMPIVMSFPVVAASTSTHTFTVRVGASSTSRLNGNNASNLFDGASISTIKITDYKQ